MKKNLWLKVFAMVMSIALWVYVISKGRVEVSVNVPVMYENVPSGLVVMNDSERSADVVLWGHERFIGDLSAGDVIISIDLEEARPGKQRIPLEIEDVKLPSSLEVLSINPRFVTVHVAKKN